MVVMFHDQNRETINRPSTGKVSVSFKIIMTTSVTRPYFTTHQTCKTKIMTKTTVCKTKTKTDFWPSNRSCPKTDGLRPHHWHSQKQLLICARRGQLDDLKFRTAICRPRLRPVPFGSLQCSPDPLVGGKGACCPSTRTPHRSLGSSGVVFWHSLVATSPAYF